MLNLGQSSKREGREKRAPVTYRRASATPVALRILDASRKTSAIAVKKKLVAIGGRKAWTSCLRFGALPGRSESTLRGYSGKSQGAQVASFSKIHSQLSR
eukprot:Blabericola_migrator_1__1413@NODE_136_length_13169_cov_18_658831_g118_i0_p4_GENE_NODE_136_length_13169_cov_18_658831_g118_i0NODE_136_length_13169_cov_18_658831_g118_i0_p4_ORF_typecomplete_len100_score1_79Microvir_J/PF04726_13/4_2e03Microvir_J/PF04726_13/0_066_NODE_136_length_13169_cov_18_658831_g118_i094629761